MKRFNVYAIRKQPKTGAVVWVPAGKAIENRDGSLAIHLDILPIDGELHARPETDGRVNADGTVPEWPKL